jgi:CheY-like chemotaxis protein
MPRSRWLQGGVEAIATLERESQIDIVLMDIERQSCLDAGESDYLLKPIVTSQLLSVMGPWLAGAA